MFPNSLKLITSYILMPLNMMDDIKIKHDLIVIVFADQSGRT